METRPAHHDEYRTHGGEDRRDRKREALPKERAAGDQNEPQDRATFVPLPNEHAGNDLEDIDEQERGQQWDGALQTDPLEWPDERTASRLTLELAQGVL